MGWDGTGRNVDGSGREGAGVSGREGTGGEGTGWEGTGGDGERQGKHYVQKFGTVPLQNVDRSFL
jgi:hypothetical protein